jgi:glycosyltransferase involved in cell wall biosynthesis
MTQRRRQEAATGTTEVIVCTFNGAAFIGEQLESILRQSLQVDGISIYDDGSSDATIARIHEFLVIGPNVSSLSSTST